MGGHAMQSASTGRFVRRCLQQMPMENFTMTHAVPSFDFYDDGLVHSHDWSRSTPPGVHHAEGRRGPQASHSHEDVVQHEVR